MKNDSKSRIRLALAVAKQHGQHLGETHHQAWIIDQMVRHLTGCPVRKDKKFRGCGIEYTSEVVGESDEYRKFLETACTGEDGSQSYEWFVGQAP